MGRETSEKRPESRNVLHHSEFNFRTLEHPAYGENLSINLIEPLPTLCYFVTLQ